MGNSDNFEAIFFFDKKGIAKEMLNQEFESFLDGMMGMPEFAGRRIQSAYVQINDSLKVCAIVFFTINFDKQGAADTSWNLPLKSLADKGVAGPDMGAGEVRIYMLGVNSNADYKAFLWDPVERAGKNDLFHVRDAVRDNKLCLSSESTEDDWSDDLPNDISDLGSVDSYEEEDDIPVATSTMVSEDNDEFSQAIKIIESQRVKITSLENALLAKNKGSSSSDKQLKKTQDALAKAQKASSDMQKAEVKLQLQKKTLEESLAKETKEHQKSGKELAKLKQSVDKLKKNHEATLASELKKLEKKFAQKIKTLEKQLDSAGDDIVKEKDAELREERKKIESLNKELTALRGDKFRIMKDGAESFFKQINDADISFMSFKPGAGHITIDLDEMAGFLENPNAIVADKCGLSVEDYEIWLQHYQKPVCNAPMPGDKICGKSVIRTDIPSKYKLGKSDRCDSHTT